MMEIARNRLFWFGASTAAVIVVLMRMSRRRDEHNAKPGQGQSKSKTKQSRLIVDSHDALRFAAEALAKLGVNEKVAEPQALNHKP